MAKANFPTSPVNGSYYTVNGKVFQYRVSGGKGEFVAVVGGFRVVASVTDLRSLVYTPGVDGVFLDATASGGLTGGRYYWDATSTATDDNCTVIAVGGVATGRWRRVYDGLLDARSFGFPADITAKTKMQAAADAQNTTPATIQPSFALPKNSEVRLGQIRIGHGPGGDWTTGNNSNLMMGHFALSSNTTGYANMAVGYETLSANTTGINNLAFGISALFFNQTGSDSCAFGVAALRSSLNGRNTAFGRSAGDNLDLGTHNTLVGYKALQQPDNGVLSTASYNVFVGDNAGTLMENGNYNIGIGVRALLCEVASGAGSNPMNNVFIGAEAGRDTVTNNACVGIGRVSSLLMRAGTGHTGVGYGTNLSIVNGTGNTAFGYEALRDSTVGLNTAVGYLSLASMTTFSNCSALGALTAVTGSNQVQLGDSATTTYVYGTVQNRSDARDKADIADTSLGLSFIESLRPVDYRWDMREDYKEKGQLLADVVKDGSKKRSRLHHGFIAQELPESFGGLQDHKKGGGEDVMSVGYDEFIAPMVRAIQELSAKVKELEAKLAKK